MTRLSARQVIYAAIVGDLLVAGTKFTAAGWTGSSAMTSEAVHSLVDTGNSLVLLYGLHRADTPADKDHPLGYGREIYFWSFVVVVAVFALGTGVSLYQGITHILHPIVMRDVTVNYIVLALSAVFDGTTWFIALRRFKGRMRSSELFRAIRKSKDPPSFIVLFQDSAALVGLVIAFVGTYLSVRLGLPLIDGLASVLIGLVLGGSAAILAQETKGLLIGEPADPSIVASILRLATETEGVARANGIITLHLAPTQIIVALSLEFADELRTTDIEIKVADLERRLRYLHPEVVALFVKPQSATVYKNAHPIVP